MSQDRLTLIVCMTTFLSYLPEAGEYSCFFVYLRLVSFECTLLLHPDMAQTAHHAVVNLLFFLDFGECLLRAMPVQVIGLLSLDLFLLN